jgi:Nuclease-related domain/AAA domain
MARMIPVIKVGSNPRGEKKFYLRVKDRLPADFCVFHSVDYSTVTGGRGVITGEVDFLILHKEKGLLVVEVKGGEEIEYNPATREWVSVDLGNTHHTIKNPFEQAIKNIQALIEKIRESRLFGRKNVGLPFTYGHSVAFPDAKVDCVNFPPDCPRDLVLDAVDLRDVNKAVNRIMEEHAGRGSKPGLDAKQYDDLINKVLLPHFKVARSVGLEVEEEEEVLMRLTEEQCKLLDFLGEHRRALIEGYAGTGKTFLAVEKARRLALEGKKVLLVCFNRPLMEHIREIVRALGSGSDNVTVNTFHGLCIESAEEAGIDVEIPEDDSKAISAFWQEDAPRLLLEAAGRLDMQFDALIIDEGQDFHEDWFQVLMQLLRDPGEGYLYIFYDPMQDIYGKKTVFPIDDKPFRLTRNCRNTRRIASFFSQVGDIKYDFTESLVNGKKVTTCCCVDEPQAQLEKIDQIVKDLIAEDIRPGQIIILSPRKREKSCFAERDSVAGIPLSDSLKPDDEKTIRFSTLKRFKGLEADVVIFCDVDGKPPTCSKFDQYVSMSRAKHLLFVLHTQSWTPPKGAAVSGKPRR